MFFLLSECLIFKVELHHLFPYLKIMPMEPYRGWLFWQSRSVWIGLLCPREGFGPQEPLWVKNWCLLGVFPFCPFRLSKFRLFAIFI